MKLALKIIFVVFVSLGFAKQSVQFIPVERSVENENVKIYIVFPEKADVESDSDVWIQLRLRNYSLGEETTLDRAKELANAKYGQSIHVIVDNNPFFPRIGPSLAPYDEEGQFRDSMYRFKIPYPLSDGKHFLRVFPARSYGESLKEEGCFEASYFYVKNKKDLNYQNLQDPYLTYNEPSGYIRYKKGSPVLLDFYLNNCQLSQDGYKVLITIDNDIKRTLTSWVPYYIYGLQKGKHTVRLQLVDKNLKQLPGFFNDNQRSFYID
ncbi:MAG: hypothetical protein JXA94_02495 [Parachlamydiales bacterium]|nr:hypothetical protein [Parachlamydiales bacterium]